MTGEGRLSFEEESVYNSIQSTENRLDDGEHNRMIRLAIYNQKGGTGKTTTAVNLGASLAELRQRVLIIDLDPQSSASQWIGERGSREGLLDALLRQEDLTPLATGTRAPWVSIVPSSLALSEAEHLLAVRENGMLALRRCVEKMPPLWDYLLIDCPPTIGALALNGLAAANWVLAPIEDSPLAFSVAPNQEQIVATVRQTMNPDLRMLGYLLCRSRNSKARRKESLDRLRRRVDSPVIDLVIRRNKIFSEASESGRPVSVHAPRSAATKDYFRLARWTLDQTKGDRLS